MWRRLLNIACRVVQICTGAIFGPVMAVLSHWFKERRATALGVLAFGASIGGTILPIAFRDIEVKIG